MSEAKDTLLKEMMMDSKQFIQDPALSDLIMNKIMKHDKKRSIMKRAVFYFVTIFCTVMLVILFSRPMVREISSITIQLTSEKILQFFSALSDHLRLFVVLFILVIIQRWMSVKASV